MEPNNRECQFDFSWREGDSEDVIERLEEIQSTTDMIWPYLVRLADTWEKKFLPAITGEQAIIVSGGNLSAKKWSKEMSPSVEPLPLPEIASLIGIKNKPLLKDAFEDLFKMCDEIVELIREKYEDAIPANYKVPRPIKSDSSMGEKYGYAIPDDCPVPKEMMPQILYAGDYLIKNYSDKQSMSLAAVTKLSVGNGIIVPTSKQSSASYVDLGRIFEFARPWVRYALIEGMESMDDSLLDSSLSSDYELTGADLLSGWGVLSKVGEFSSVTSPSPQGGSHTRSVYKSRKSE